MQGKNKQLVQRDNARKCCSQNPDMDELAASCTKRLPPEPQALSAHTLTHTQLLHSSSESGEQLLLNAPKSDTVLNYLGNHKH